MEGCLARLNHPPVVWLGCSLYFKMDGGKMD